MFDYGDDEVENKFIYSRSRAKGDDSSSRVHLTENFNSDFRVMAGNYTGGRVLRNDRNQTNVLPFLIKKPLSHPVFPPSHGDKDHPDSFFSSMRFIVEFAQIFSMLPITGYRGPNYKSLHFRWIHWKIVYSAANIVLGGFLFACITWWNVTHGLTYDNSAVLVFFLSTLAASLLILQLATKWREICFDFAEIENKLYKYGYPIGKTRQFKFLTCTFMIIAFVEHALSRTVQIQKILPCASDERIITIIKTFMAHNYREVFTYIPFNIWLGICLIITHFLCTFAWNFSDLLLGLISWSISARFKLFNESLFKVQGQRMDVAFWRRTRIDYNELTNLTRKIDNHIQKLMLLSLGDNLYLICIQLLKGLKKSGNLYETIYFFWSVGFIILRTCFVAFSAAAIYDESKEAKTVLYSVPESDYCAETRRFLAQLSTNDVALTGCQFFSITRGLILTIAGTIITYEVILVQFNTENSSDYHNDTQCFKF